MPREHKYTHSAHVVTLPPPPSLPQGQSLRVRLQAFTCTGGCSDDDGGGGRGGADRDGIRPGQGGGTVGEGGGGGGGHM